MLNYCSGWYKQSCRERLKWNVISMYAVRINEYDSVDL